MFLSAIVKAHSDGLAADLAKLAANSDDSAVETAVSADADVDALAAALRAVEPFTEASVETAVRETAAARGLNAGSLIHATRVAVTGRTSSPGLFDVLVLLGRERTLERLAGLSAFLASRPST